MRRLLEPISRNSGESASSDEALLEAYKQLSGLPKNIFAYVEDEPESFPQCPLSDDAPEDIRILSARALEKRLKVLQEAEGSISDPTPEIRLDAEEITPGISLTPSDSSTPENVVTSTTLLESRKRIFGTAHPKHCSALLRLVYLHNTINPGNLSYHTPSILIPLYSVLLQEVEVEELTHVEADTFWLLEALVAEFSGLEDEEGTVWMQKLSDRLTWVDFDFKAHLVCAHAHCPSTASLKFNIRKPLGWTLLCHIIHSMCLLSVHDSSCLIFKQSVANAYIDPYIAIAIFIPCVGRTFLPAATRKNFKSQIGLSDRCFR